MPTAGWCAEDDKDRATVKVTGVAAEAARLKELPWRCEMERCQRCEAEVEYLNRTSNGVGMCDYCYKSLIGMWIECHGKNAELGKAIAQCFNLLEAKLDEKIRAVR